MASSHLIAPLLLHALFIGALILVAPNQGNAQAHEEGFNELLGSGAISKDTLAAIALSGDLPKGVADSLIIELLNTLDSLSSGNVYALTYSATRSSRNHRIQRWQNCIDYIGSIIPLDTLHYTRALNYLGSTYNSIGKRDSALHAFISVIDFLPAEIPYEELAVAHNNAGSIFDRRDNPQAALENYQRARSLFEQLLGESHYYIGLIENNIGQSLHRLGRLDEQVKVQTHGLNIYLQSIGRDHIATSNIYLNLGIAYRDMHRHDQAREAFQNALEIRRTLNRPKDVVAVQSEICAMMSVFDEHYSQDQILEYQKQCIIEGTANLDSNSSAFRSIYNNYAIGLLSRDSLDEALRYMHKAMAMQYRGVEFDKPHSLPEVSKINTPLLDDYKIIENKAYILYRIYQRDGIVSSLKESMQLYMAGDTILSDLRKSLVNTFSRKSLIMHAEDYFINAATTAFELYLAVGDYSHLDQAFIWTEKSRNWDLTDKYSRTQRAGQILEDSSFDSLLSDPDRNSVEVELLRQQYPAHFELVYGLDIATLESVKKYCARYDAWWIYYMSFNADRYAFIFINADSAYASRQVWHLDSMRQHTAQMKQSIEDRSWSFAIPSHAVYNLIFRDFEGLADSGKLIVSATKSPLDIAWDALCTYPAETPDSIARSYLAHKNELVFMPSATWALTTEKSKAHIENSAFIAPVYKSNTLVYNSEEARLGADIMQGDLITGGATSYAMVNAMKTYDHIHFAGHSVTHATALDSIFMLLGDGDDTLAMPALMRGESTASFVVLGSCYSFDGKPSAEGRMGLNYAIALAGTPNIISSQWAASDRESSSLFSQFYTLVHAGVNSDAALAQAKRMYLDAAPLPGKHPYYWANWTYYGHAVQAVYVHRDYLATTILGLAALVLCGLYYFNARRSSAAVSENSESPSAS